MYCVIRIMGSEAAGLLQLFVILSSYSFSLPFPWCVLLVLTTEHVGHFFFDAAAEVLPNEVDAPPEIIGSWRVHVAVLLSVDPLVTSRKKTGTGLHYILLAATAFLHTDAEDRQSSVPSRFLGPLAGCFFHECLGPLPDGFALFCFFSRLPPAETPVDHLSQFFLSHTSRLHFCTFFRLVVDSSTCSWELLQHHEVTVATTFSTFDRKITGLRGPVPQS